jgi:hypothetical protein
MQKCIGDIELNHKPVPIGGDGENHAHSAWFNHQHKGFIEVNFCALGEATNNHPALYLSKLQSGWNLCLNTHLLVTALARDG